jgi:hypothetical protein
MSRCNLSVLIVCIMLLPSLMPIVIIESREVDASEITAKDNDSEGRAISQSTEGRSNLEKTVGGGSWTEYFDKGTSAALNRTRAIDGKLQLETDITSLTKWSGNPVLTGSVGKFDSSGMRMNSVLFDNGTFKMWYGGYDGTHFITGYATSIDGINWTKQNSGNPVMNLGAAGTWDDNYAMVGSVIKDGDTYRMWYSGNDHANSQTGYATSSDGITWVKNAGNPVVKIAANTCYTNHIGPSTMIKEGNTYKGWFTCNNGNGNAGSRITYGTSNNGVAWAINANAVFGIGPNGAFDSTGVSVPHVWKEGDRYYMTYAGWNGESGDRGSGILRWESMDPNEQRQSCNR